MANTIEVRKEDDILLSLDNINELPESDPNPLDDLPENEEEKVKEMNKRLRKLVELTWNQDKIRLIAWSEEDHCWYMWPEA